MSRKHKLPFKVGDMVEARSFIEGYRSSWFRCKIREIRWKKGSIGCILEYIDFPDEEKTWEQFYQKPLTAKGKRKDTQTELMVRPCYPPIYQENQDSDSRKNHEISVIVNRDLKIGDSVDWWADNVYWCAKVIQLMDLDRAKIQLPDPPIGEGLTYDVQVKDLRPTLIWSPEQGWTVPLNQVDGSRLCCARLIKPTKDGEQTTIQVEDDAQKSTYEKNASLTSHASPSLSPPSHTSEHHPSNLSQNKKLDKCESVEANNREYEALKADGIKGSEYEGTQKRMKMKAKVNGCTESSDSIEASILELEELLCKVKWLKMVLNHGSPKLNTHPSWKYEENRVTATPKTGSTIEIQEMK